MKQQLKQKAGFQQSPTTTYSAVDPEVQPISKQDNQLTPI